MKQNKTISVITNGFIYFISFLFINISIFCINFSLYNNKPLNFINIINFSHNLLFIFNIILYLIIYYSLNLWLKNKIIATFTIYTLIFTNSIFILIMTGQNINLLLDYSLIFNILFYIFLIQFKFKYVNILFTIVLLLHLILWYINMQNSISYILILTVILWIYLVYNLLKDNDIKNNLKIKTFLYIVILNILTPITYILALQT